MATYKYTAISKDGVKVSGVVEGFHEFDAVDRIKQDCDIVLKLTEVEEKKPGLLSMEIGGNRRLVCQKAKRTEVNGGAALLFSGADAPPLTPPEGAVCP